MVLEASEAASLCHSHILQQRTGVYLQPLVTQQNDQCIFHMIKHCGLMHVCFCTFSRPEKCGCFLAKVYNNSIVRLPKCVLAVKHELPNVSRLTCSLQTGPLFHMRSQPPTLFSLPASLKRTNKLLKVNFKSKKNKLKNFYRRSNINEEYVYNEWRGRVCSQLKEKKAFTFPPYQQHSKCLPAAGTSFRNPLDYWECVTGRHSPQLTTCTETGDDTHQTF